MLDTRFASAAALAVLAGLATPTPGCELLRAGISAPVHAVEDGASLTLRNGDRVRLIGLMAPKTGDGASPELVEGARLALERLVAGREVMLRFGGTAEDRHGRRLAQVFVAGPDGEIWVQRALVRGGWGRVYSFADNRACIEDLLSAERQARADRLGLWADRHFDIAAADRPDALADRVGRFVLVEGRVLGVGTSRGTVYVNFGTTWRSDVTLTLDKAAQRLFAAEGADVARLAGALIRVRGHMDMAGGPHIGLTHPEQIEVLAR